MTNGTIWHMCYPAIIVLLGQSSGPGIAVNLHIQASQKALLGTKLFGCHPHTGVVMFNLVELVIKGLDISLDTLLAIGI